MSSENWEYWNTLYRMLSTAHILLMKCTFPWEPTALKRSVIALQWKDRLHDGITFTSTPLYSGHTPYSWSMHWATVRKLLLQSNFRGIMQNWRGWYCLIIIHDLVEKQKVVNYDVKCRQQIHARMDWSFLNLATDYLPREMGKQVALILGISLAKG